MIKQYILYLIRWQLSSPILALVLYLFNYNIIIETIIANFLGGLAFFWVDKYIFKQTILFPLWQVQEEVKCVDCGEVCRGYRLVKSRNYDRIKDSEPEFRCERCSRNKLMMLREKGIEY